METPIHHRLSHIGQKQLNLRRRQPDSLERPAAQSLQAIHNCRSPKQTAESKLLIRRPKPKGQLLGDLGDILEPSLSHLLRSLLDGADVGTHGFETGFEVLEIVTDGVWSVGCGSVIVATWIAGIDILNFEVTAWLEVSKDRSS